MKKKNQPSGKASEQYSPRAIRSFAELYNYLTNHEKPILLLEGIRALPDEARSRVVAMGRWLATALPRVVFRSGNAEGSDTAFAEGVTMVDPARMEYVIPNPGMGKKRRNVRGHSISVSEVPQSVRETLGAYTVEATPKAKRLVMQFLDERSGGALAAKGSYLIRDTFKVVGAPGQGISPACAGLFYANAVDPYAGGTGHTIRVCVQQRVPVILQQCWMSWGEFARAQETEGGHVT